MVGLLVTTKEGAGFRVTPNGIRRVSEGCVGDGVREVEWW